MAKKTAKPRKKSSSSELAKLAAKVLANGGKCNEKEAMALSASVLSQYELREEKK